MPSPFRLRGLGAHAACIALLAGGVPAAESLAQSGGSPLTFDPADGGWSLHPWSHEFDVAEDIDHWHAPHRLGGRDPDDRHVGKQRREREGGPLVDNRAEFAELAYVDTAQGHLVMNSVFDPAAGEWDSDGMQDGEARMPYLISFANFTTLDDDGRPRNWVGEFPRPCTDESGTVATLPCDFIIDPAAGEHFIETRVSFEGASEAFKTWWAFWLFSRSDNYDGDPDTGMEVDALEYVPYVAPDGFNAAMFRGEADGNGNEPRVPQSSDRPFTANRPDTDEFMRRVNARYDACRGDDSCAPIRLDEGFHTVGIAYSRERYAFYLDGYLFWEVTDPDWITREAELGIQLTWEKDEGVVLDDADGDGLIDYLDDGVGGSPEDGVPDWRQSPKRTNLSYGPWGQGFATDIYDGPCLVEVDNGPLAARYRDRYTFDMVRDSYAVSADDLRIVDGSCNLRLHATSHPDSSVRVDYMRVYMRD